MNITVEKKNHWAKDIKEKQWRDLNNVLMTFLTILVK